MADTEVQPTCPMCHRVLGTEYVTCALFGHSGVCRLGQDLMRKNSDDIKAEYEAATGVTPEMRAMLATRSCLVCGGMLPPAYTVFFPEGETCGMRCGVAWLEKVERRRRPLWRRLLGIA